MPDRATISRRRWWLNDATHPAVFRFVLAEVARHGLPQSKTIGIDATTMEANAAIHSIVRRDTSENCRAHLRRLAAEGGRRSKGRRGTAHGSQAEEEEDVE